ncbi:hypothetical protein ABTL47_19385, partial [Acinetobacter baumannii]
ASPQISLEVYEGYYKEKIDNARSQGHNVIIAGVTSRIPPREDDQYNITTSLIPPIDLTENEAYQQDNTLMIPDFVEGVIHFDHQTNTVR